MTDTNIPVRRALLSVWDKSTLIEFARELKDFGVELLCSSGTAAHLSEAGIQTTSLSALTGFDDLLGGRVKTLHPSIYASILARPGEDERELAEHKLQPLDLVVVDLYPFADTVAAEADVSEDEVIEKIDIGGVCLLRAAAKNFVRTIAVHDSAGREQLLSELRRCDGRTELAWRRQMAAAAIRATSAYDRRIADWLQVSGEEGAAEHEPPPVLSMQWQRQKRLRYGENPHQSAALYLREGGGDAGVYSAKQLQGKEISYNNLQDAHAAWQSVQMFKEPACVVVKHANPCAAALGDSPLDAWQRALKADSTSPFGGIVAVNSEMDGETARALLDFGFLEVVLAPAFSAAAQEVFSARRNLRLLQVAADQGDAANSWQWAGSGNALLVQSPDVAARCLDKSALQVAGKKVPDEEQMRDLLFAWKMVSMVKSNAILCAHRGALTAVGAGQMSRVFSLQIAALKAEQEEMELRGNVLASDAFFPFRDSVDLAAELGISAIIQPGGSVRDGEVIEAADEHGIAMVFTGMRHFRH